MAGQRPDVRHDRTARLVFLGRLADVAGAEELDVPASGGWADLHPALSADLAEAISGPRVRIAVNGALIAGLEALRFGAGDEVAFLPPVSGG